MADNVKIGYSRRIHKRLQAFLFNLMGQTSSYDKYFRRYGFFKKGCFITTRVDRPLVVLSLAARPSVRPSVRASVHTFLSHAITQKILDESSSNFTH